MAHALDRIAFYCGNCRATLRTQPESAGKIVECPKCDAMIRIPRPQQHVDTQALHSRPTPSLHGDELPGHYRPTMTTAADPQKRLDVICTLSEMVRVRGHGEALSEMLETVQHDPSGEVVLATAFCIANPPAEWRPIVRQAVWQTFVDAADTNTVHGAPLLRLSYVAVFENDLDTLDQMVKLRKRDAGVERIDQIADALASRDLGTVFQLMVWCEGLDAEFSVDVFQSLKERSTGGESFVQRIEQSVREVRQFGGF